jgi:hypothetical protein
MAFGISRWRPRHMLATWAAYWAALLLVALGPAVLSIWRVSQSSEKGNVSLGLDNALVHLTVMNGPTTTWSGSALLSTLALWIAGPPLLLWVVWLFTRPSRPPLVTSAGAVDALQAGDHVDGRATRATSAHRAPAVRDKDVS